MENLTENEIKKMRLRYETLFEGKTYEEAAEMLGLDKEKDEESKKEVKKKKSKKEKKNDDDVDDDDDEEEDGKDKEKGEKKSEDKDTAKSKKGKNKMGGMNSSEEGLEDINLAKNAKKNYKKNSKNEALADHKPGKFQTVVECKCGSRNLKLSEKKSMIRCKRCGYTDLVENVYGYKAVVAYNKLMEGKNK